MVDLYKFMSPEAVHTLRTTGLHKIAAALEKVANGRDVGDEINLPVAVRLLGQRIFEKRAQSRQIASGLYALKTLLGDK